MIVLFGWIFSGILMLNVGLNIIFAFYMQIRELIKRCNKKRHENKVHKLTKITSDNTVEQ